MVLTNTEGVKYDQQKPQLYRGVLLQFPLAITLLSRASEHGANKYSWSNWVDVPDGFNRYSDAMVRHLIAEGQNQVLDPDSGLPHIAHTLWNSFARAELYCKAQQ